jgi:hypothetical protein
MAVWAGILLIKQQANQKDERHRDQANGDQPQDVTPSKQSL